jgi:hypothetical protein
MNISSIKEVPRLFLINIIPLIKKIIKLQNSNYRNVSTDPLGTLGTTDKDKSTFSIQD